MAGRGAAGSASNAFDSLVSDVSLCLRIYSGTRELQLP